MQDDKDKPGTKSHQELKKEFFDRRHREQKERLERFTAKYGHLTSVEILKKIFDEQLKAEQNPTDKQAIPEQPNEIQGEEKSKLNPADKINWDSPKQRRLFEKMGLRLKVIKLDKNESK